MLLLSVFLTVEVGYNAPGVSVSVPDSCQEHVPETTLKSNAGALQELALGASQHGRFPPQASAHL
jgi:hypothetical protein